METTADVVVVGAGIMGAAAARELASRGLQVSLIEQFPLDHHRGSSHGTARIFRLAYDELEYTLLAELALPMWRTAELELRTKLLDITGGLDIGPAESLEATAATLRAAELPFEKLDADDVAERFPAFRLGEALGAVFQKEYGVVLADASRSGFIDLARNGGARVHAETRAVGLEPLDDEVRVVTDRGTIHAHRVVLATAGWSNDLLATLDLHVPLTVTREHVAYYPYPKDATILPFIAHAGPGKFEFYGLPNGPEPVVKVAKHGAGPEVDPNTEPLLEPRRLEDVNRFVERHLPSLQTVPSRAETCLYASTPDDDFVIDRRGSIVLGMGFGGHGFKFGPVIGAMLADLATDDAAAAAPKFSVARFAQRG